MPVAWQILSTLRSLAVFWEFSGGFFRIFAVRLQSKENLIHVLILRVFFRQLEKLTIFASFQNVARYFERAWLCFQLEASSFCCICLVCFKRLTLR